MIWQGDRAQINYRKFETLPEGFDLIAVERPPDNPAGMYIFRRKNQIESQENQ